MTEENPKITVEVRKVHGMTLVARGKSNHWVVMDGPEKFDGAEAGSRPMEMILMGLAGCTGMDVISLLKKMKVQYQDFRIMVEAEQSQEHPKIYTDIMMHYHIYGDGIPLEKVEKAITLSQDKYCSVSAMLKQAASISYEIHIHEKE